MMNLQVGEKINISVHEPADFFLLNGDGPYIATVEYLEENKVGIKFDSILKYENQEIQECVAQTRHEDNTFKNWDSKSSLTVNLGLPNAKSLTHLIESISKSAL